MNRSRVQLVLALLVALGGVITYLTSKSVNPVTGEVQRVSLTPQQEIALGVQSAPQMAAQFGGEVSDPALRQYVQNVGVSIVQRSDASRSPYQFQFHLLADPKTLNAFALPGGQIFLTWGLLSKLSNEGQLAGVLSHEVFHVVGRHSAEQMAKQGLTQSLVGAITVASADPNSPGRTMQNAAIAQAVAQMVNLRYGRQDELESDHEGVRYMRQAGYDPQGMVQMMEVLERAGGSRQPEFFSSHPSPEHRLVILQKLAGEQPPGGTLNEAQFRAAVSGRLQPVSPGSGGSSGWR
jgi:beta-barrel assembly-enhancing protease